MEAFEKWRETKPDYKCMIHDCEKCHQDAATIWRVALEWVKNHPDLGNQFHMTETINKELGSN